MTKITNIETLSIMRQARAKGKILSEQEIDEVNNHFNLQKYLQTKTERKSIVDKIKDFIKRKDNGKH